MDNQKGSVQMLTLDKIYHASYVLKDVIRHTHIVKAEGISDDCEVYLKPENLQITGSFKVRGSGYKISQLTHDEKKRGVIACSAGNHAQALRLPLQSTASSRSSVCPTVRLSQRSRLQRATAARFVWFPAFMTTPTTRL